MSLSLLSGTESVSFLKSVREHGFSYCSLGLRTPEGRFYGVFSDTSWQEWYRNLELYTFDPLYQTAMRLFDTPIIWDSVPCVTKKAANVMKLRQEITGVTSGVTISFHTENYNSILAIGGLEGERLFLKKFSIFFPLILQTVHQFQCHLYPKL